MVRRWHGREFKLEAVRLVREGGAPAAQIARDLGIHPHLLHKWTKEFETDPQHSFPGQGKMKPGATRDRAAAARSTEAQGRAGYPKKSRGLLCEGEHVKFSFIAKHRGIWPAAWMCEALGVSRGGFYAWLTRPRSARSRSNEDLAARVRASFLASHRTYGARRVWFDMIDEGVACGLHRIERLMRLHGLRPRRRRLPPDLGERQAAAIAANVLDRRFQGPGSQPQMDR